MGAVKRLIESLIPRRFYRALLSPYHAAWAIGSAFLLGFPARRLTVIGVTGTKGKSSVAEMLHAILSAAGHRTALASTIRFAIGNESEPNLFKMTVPGRGFLQGFLARAVEKGATHAIIELTSEAALQHRHRFLYLDALVFTNLQKEHLESHGGMENYFRAKLTIAHVLATSPKRPRAVVANVDDTYGARFLKTPVEKQIGFSYGDAGNAVLTDDGVSFDYDNQHFSLPHAGKHTVLNTLAAIKMAVFLGVPLEVAAQSLRDLSLIKGRGERVSVGQDFLAIVDYAHTPDSLRALYASFPSRRKICVLGNTGGGRDTWKRPLMGSIADEACAEVILTDEDPYDETPRTIVEEMARGMKRAPRIIMDRREAIRTALSLAKTGDAVLISGKGTDPYIMRARGAKEPWYDAVVVAEELRKLVS